MKHLLVLLCICFLPISSASAEKQLSRTIQFDRYMMHARNAISRGDYGTAADNYERAQKLNTDPPESFYLDYSASLGALGRWKGAKSVLHTYFQHFDKEGKYYELALRRYVEAEDKVDRHSEERIRPELQGLASPFVRPVTAPAPTWVPQKPVQQAPPQVQAQVPIGVPRMEDQQQVQQTQQAQGQRVVLERLIGSYSGEAKEAEAIARSNNCDQPEGRPHPAYDCFYGYHRNMSLNMIDGSGVVGFVKVDYVREHRPASNGDSREDRPTTYQQIEYYLSIRLWVTANGLIQGQQKPLCEFVVAEKICSQVAKAGMTPLRAKMMAGGGLALESEKGGGPRVYLKVDTTPDVVRGDVVHVVPALGNFLIAPGGSPDRPTQVEAKPGVGDTAAVGAEMDDLVAARFAASR